VAMIYPFFYDMLLTPIHIYALYSDNFKWIFSGFHNIKGLDNSKIYRKQSNLLRNDLFVLYLE
jgi:uncharacterized protein (DUF2225 family)